MMRRTHKRLHLGWFGLFLGLAGTVLLLPAQAAAQPVSWPADKEYQPVLCRASPSWDPQGDVTGAKGDRDVAGSSASPAILLHSDGSFAYFRWRLDGDPTTTSGGQRPLIQAGWALGLDTDGNPGSMEYYLMVDGNMAPEEVRLVRVSDGSTRLTLKPTMDLSAPAPPGQTHAPGWVEVRGATGVSFGGDPDYFMTLAVPLLAVMSATAGDPRPVTWQKMYIWVVTSSNGAGLNGDMACWDERKGTPVLQTAAGGPVSFKIVVPDGVSKPDAGPPDAAGRDLPRLDRSPPADLARPDRQGPDRATAPDSAPRDAARADARRRDTRVDVLRKDLARADAPRGDGRPAVDRSRQDRAAVDHRRPGPDARRPDSAPSADRGLLQYYGGGGCSVAGSTPAAALPALLLLAAVRRRRRGRR